jgi:hypothetical protein
MSLDGATSFIIVWSKDSDTWDVRHSNTWLVQPEFNSCYQMVVVNGPFKNSWQLYIDNDKAWGMQPKDDYAMSACIHQPIIYGVDVQQGWPTGGMQVYLMQPTSE